MFFGLFPSKKEEKSTPETQKNKTPETNQDQKPSQPEPQQKTDMNFFDSLQVKKKEKTGQKGSFDPFGLGSSTNTQSNPTTSDTQGFNNQSGGFDTHSNQQFSDNSFGTSNMGGFGNQQQEQPKPSTTGSKKFSKFQKKNTDADNAPPMFISNANFESLGMEDPSQRYQSNENLETTSNHSGTGRSESDHSSQINQDVPMNFKKSGGFDPFGMEKKSFNPFDMGGSNTGFQTRSEPVEERHDAPLEQVEQQSAPAPKRFGKFAKKEAPKEDVLSIPSRDDTSSVHSERYDRTEDHTPPAKSSPSIYTSKSNDKHHQVLPQPISPPMFSETETPEMVNMRLEVERNTLIEKIGDMIIRQNNLMQKKKSLDDERAGLSKRLAIVVKQQEDAIEKENFEAADEFEVVIGQLKESSKALSKESDDCQLAYAEYEKEKQMLYQQEYMIYKNWIAAIEKITLTQKHNFDRYKTECLSQQSNEKSYIDEESHRLQLEKNHIDLDLKHIGDETSQYNENLSKQTKDYVSEQQQLSSKKIELEVLIEQIRRELANKERELADTTASLDKVTSKINTIKSKFDDQLRKLDMKRETVGQHETEYEHSMKQLNRYKDNAENNLRNYEDNCIRAQKMFDEYTQIKGSFGDRVHTIQAENNLREDALNSYYNSLNELTQIKSQFDFIQGEIEKLKQDSIFFQKEISDLTAEKNNLEAKIPQLEKDKKSFATTRNFKEASRVSNEIKDIQTKLEEVANHLNQKVSMDRATQEKIFLHEKQNIPNIENKIHNIQEKCDRNKYHFLVIRETDLRTLKQHYYDQKQYEEIGVIENELKDAIQQIEQLKTKYKDLSGKQETVTPVEEAKNEPEDVPIEQQETHVDHVEEQPAEYKEEAPQEEEVHQEEEAPVVEEKTPAEYLSEYETLDATDKQLDETIEQLASAEKFEEAEGYSATQQQVKDKKEHILERVKALGYESIEALREAIGQTQE